MSHHRRAPPAASRPTAGTPSRVQRRGRPRPLRRSARWAARSCSSAPRPARPSRSRTAARTAPTRSVAGTLDRRHRALRAVRLRLRRRRPVRRASRRSRACRSAPQVASYPVAGVRRPGLGLARRAGSRAPAPGARAALARRRRLGRPSAARARSAAGFLLLHENFADVTQVPFVAPEIAPAVLGSDAAAARRRGHRDHGGAAPRVPARAAAGLAGRACSAAERRRVRAPCRTGFFLSPAGLGRPLGRRPLPTATVGAAALHPARHAGRRAHAAACCGGSAATSRVDDADADATVAGDVRRLLRARARRDGDRAGGARPRRPRARGQRRAPTSRRSRSARSCSPCWPRKASPRPDPTHPLDLTPHARPTPRHDPGAPVPELKGFAPPYTASGRSALIPDPPWFYSGDLLTVEYRTDVEKVRALLPADVELAEEDPGAVAMIWADWQSCSAGRSRSSSTRRAVAVQGGVRGRPLPVRGRRPTRAACSSGSRPTSRSRAGCTRATRRSSARSTRPGRCPTARARRGSRPAGASARPSRRTTTGSRRPSSRSPGRARPTASSTRCRCCTTARCGRSSAAPRAGRSTRCSR